MSRTKTLFVLFALACDGDEGPAERGHVGKADLYGSCAMSDCSGRSPNGNCYCDAGCTAYGDCCADREMLCGGSSGAPGVPELGADPTFTTIAGASDGLDRPRDLAFHPTRSSELWTLNQGYEGVLIITNPGQMSQREERRIDSHGAHFMAAPSSLAFGAENTFASCQESTNGGNYFMGPSLWSADLSIFAAVNQEGPLLGSHLDMLHQSPLCMGVEHDAGNVYWVFDGHSGHVVRYDFQVDHGPGYDDHSDGIVRRYPEARVRRRQGVPGHMVLDRASGLLYVADTGANRVIRLDTRTGTARALPPPTNEPLVEYSEVTGTTEDVFASGIVSPSGIVLANGRLFVGSFATGEIVAFDLAGSELGRVSTGATGLMGLAFGQSKLWFTDGLGNKVVRVDP